MASIKKSSLITLVIAVVIIVIGIFAYQSIVQPFLENNISQTIEIDLEETQEIRLGKKTNQEKIFSLEIEITGTSSNNLSIDLLDDNIEMYNAKVKKGAIDIAIAQDWYSDSVIIVINTKDPEDDKLSIDYRFLSL